MQYLLTIRPGIEPAIRKEIEEILKKHQYIITGVTTKGEGIIIKSDITFMDTDET